ncbi:P60-like protein [Coniophora puteana RWD-64-598 SS2]|uniref:Ribosome biogenesis protein NOP53 n=1 Tax=Coniophora puteana (strain RWD-64-598) TaxID=741705 RepID=A0A5M3MKF3_CONPW|nr:P60-like protein [Coniophora puteana RWD-64-598 SS2]EIW79440.1 P60-like protein [Coniophora puteana RWD-64-598 SS2]
MAVTRSKKSGSNSDTMAGKTDAKADVGAPAQLSQSSRKGKRAWRKNIDIQPIERGMESLRKEERIIGTTLQHQSDDQLFTIDVKGDDKTRRSLPRFSKADLTSTKIIAQRSAVPAVHTRTTSSASSTQSKPKISGTDKTRLLRMTRRMARGPFNAVMDPTELGAGSAMVDVTHAVKASGSYDAWAMEEDVDEDEEDETLKRPQIKKRPDNRHPRELIEAPAVAKPHQGASYNPPVAAHEELILKAYESERQKEVEAQKFAGVKEQIIGARKALDVLAGEDGIPEGMVLDEIADDGSEEVEDADVLAQRAPSRKTKQQRAKAARLKAEKHALAERALRKRLLGSVSQARSFRKEADRSAETREQARLARLFAQNAKLKQGLAGQKIGKHKVPNSRVDVQLGEDLSESFRALKPEGNLFRDRFDSLQQRALVEPHALATSAPNRRKTKEYEKHAYKRFV